MTYVITEPCIDVLDRSCLDQRPVDCIYQGSRALYIQPDRWAAFTLDTATCFAEPLPGATTALGSPGDAAKLGRLGADTPLNAVCPGRGR